MTRRGISSPDSAHNMAERCYTHTADPAVNCLLPNGRVLTAGSTVRIDLAECPEWSAPVKWVRLGWLTEVDEPHDDALPKDDALPTVDNAPPQSNEDRMTPAEIDRLLEMTGEEWLESHTVMELRAMCSDRGIPYSGMRKAELIEAIMEHD